MIFPIAKLTSGLAAVATTLTSKGISISNNVPAACLHVAIKDIPPPPVNNVLALIRGGGGAATATSVIVDFQRESLLLQGLATYGTITALIMNASLRLFTSVKFKKEQNKIVCNTFNIATALCIISGAFTAILFQLLTIYSKSALGHSNDAGYLAFKAATRELRFWGFRCFLTEMISFVVSFMASLYNLLWDNARRREKTSSGSDFGSKAALTRTGNFIFGGSVILIVAGLYQIRSVLVLAAEHIYSMQI